MKLARTCATFEYDPSILGLRNEELPKELTELLEEVRRLSLPRDTREWNCCSIFSAGYLQIRLSVWEASSPLPGETAPQPNRANSGMSPKKYHEVTRMTNFIAELLEKTSSALGRDVKHIVDIGAGKGHLSRALHKLTINSEGVD